MHRTIRICRLCLEIEQPSATSMDDETFRAKLNAVSNFTFEDNRQLPADVCSECSQRIDQFYTFMESVRSNQERLQLSHPPTQVKDDIYQESNTVKNEVESPEHNTEPMEVEVEMYENPPVAVKTEEETDPEEPVENEDEDVEEPASPLLVERDGPNKISDEDRLIKEFFSLKCDKCSESFDTLKHLRSHAKKLHNSRAVLHCCNKSFSFRNKILYHINTHLKPYKCEECGKSFPGKYTLKVHITAKHAGSEEHRFKCDKCNRSFQTEGILQSHLRLHERVECSVCKKTLSNMYTLKTHMSIIHSDERNFICDACGKDFKSRGAFDSHKLTHKELKREDGARCEICHKWISRKRYLRSHMIKIHQAKEVTCNICHKVYRNEKSLKAHTGLVHRETRDKLECEFCGKRFKRNINLREHRASHTGEKLYSCEFCGLEMNSSGNLYSHKKNKHHEQWMEAKQRADKFLD